MIKLAATVNVVAWSMFWTFGLIALSADPSNTRQIEGALVLAALGGGIGMLTYFRCIRHCEATGYAKRPNRVPEHIKTEGEFA